MALGRILPSLKGYVGSSLKAYVGSSLKGYVGRAFLAPYSTRVLVPYRNKDADDSPDDEVLDDRTVILDDLTDDEGPFGGPSYPPIRVASSVVRRPWNVVQDHKGLKFRMDMPGLSREEVKVYLDNGTLVVKGQHKLSDGEKDDDFEEDIYGSYDAEVLLPENVQTDQIKSEMKHGVLFVTAPKQVTFIPVE